MMTDNQEVPEFNAEIKQQFKVILDDAIYIAKTEEDAKRLKKELEEKAREDWLINHNKEKQRKEWLEFLEKNLNNYIDYLKKQLWHDTRNPNLSKEMIDKIKQIHKDLENIYLGEKKCQYNPGFMEDKSHYSIVDTDDKDKKRMGVKND